MSRLIDADEIEKLVKSDNPMHHEQVSIYAIRELAQFAAMIDKTLETLEKRKEAGTEKISVVQKGDKKQ